MAPAYQIGVVRDQITGDIAGMGFRGIQPRYINGQVEEIGYITDLLVDSQYHGRWVYARLLRLLRQLHMDQRVPGYLIVIAEGNDVLHRDVLANFPRRHVPEVRELDRLLTLALIVHRPKPVNPTGFQISRGSDAELDTIVAFLRRYGAARQFFPAYGRDDFRPGSPTTLGFQTEHFLLAKREGELIGVLAIWDRSSFRQTIVESYSRALNLARPLYDRASRILGAQPLPKPKQAVNAAYAAFPCVAGDDPEVFRALLQSAHNLAAQGHHAYLMIGLTSRDPLLRVARRFPHIPYWSKLYTVTYQGEHSFHDRLDDRVPYLELAAI